MRLVAILTLVFTSALARAEVVDLVVAGGGPAGLAAAIEARQQGLARVVVVEKRAEPSRHQPLALFRANVENLAHWGVDVKDAITVADGQAHVLKQPLDTSRTTSHIEGLAPDNAVGFVPTQRLERELLLAAQRIGGIEIVQETSVVGVSPDGTGVSTRVEAKSGARTIRSRYVVLAAGAHDGLPQAVGMQRVRNEAVSARLVSGVFDQAGKGAWRSVQSGNDFAVREGAARESVLASVPDHVSFSSNEALEQWYRGQARALGLTGSFLAAPRAFEVRLDRLTKHTAFDRVFAIGDTARTTHPATGEGANFALRDAARVGKLLGKLDGQTPTERRLAIDRFERDTSHATQVTHAHALPFMKKAR